MVSTMELSTLARIGELEPGLRRGWTYPKVTKDWASKRWAKAPMLAALVWMRQRLPGLAARELPKMGVEAMWVYHPLVSRQLAKITDLARVELIAWTVDDLPPMSKLVARRRRRHLLQRPAPVRVASESLTPCGVVNASRLRPCQASPSAGRCGRVCVFTADSISSAVKPPTASPSSA